MVYFPIVKLSRPDPMAFSFKAGQPSVGNFFASLFSHFHPEQVALKAQIVVEIECMLIEHFQLF